MKIYLAARFSLRHYLRDVVRPALERVGHQVVSHWINEDDRGNPRHIDWPRTNLTDIDGADAVVHFADDGTSGKPQKGGRHFELGYALGRMKLCVHVGHPEHLFHAYPQCRMVGDLGALVELMADTTVQTMARLATERNAGYVASGNGWRAAEPPPWSDQYDVVRVHDGYEWYNHPLRGWVMLGAAQSPTTTTAAPLLGELAYAGRALHNPPLPVLPPTTTLAPVLDSSTARRFLDTILLGVTPTPGQVAAIEAAAASPTIGLLGATAPRPGEDSVMTNEDQKKTQEGARRGFDSLYADSGQWPPKWSTRVVEMFAVGDDPPPGKKFVVRDGKVYVEDA